MVRWSVNVCMICLSFASSIFASELHVECETAFGGAEAAIQIKA